MANKKAIFITSAILLVKMLTSAAFAAGETITVPRRPAPPPATVAIIKDNSVDYDAMMEQALEAALGPGGISNLVSSGQTVVIKPNLVTNKTNAVTDWRVVRALVDQIKTVNGGAAITIAEGSCCNHTSSVMNGQGYTSSNFPGVSLVDLNDLGEAPSNYFELTDGASDNTTKQVAALIYEADIFIDVPKMKTHYHAGFTGALKNIGIGVPSWDVWHDGGSKAKLHRDIRREILDHVLCRVPDLTVMDAIKGMEGQGPTSGSMVTMNLILASRDIVALDAVACEIMDIPPYLITHLVLAANENAGSMDLNNINIAGNVTIADVQHSFDRADPGSPQASYELAVIPYRATTVIRTAPAGGVAIDGDLSEWVGANPIDIDDAEQVKSGDSRNGAEDLSATGLFMYDANNLYFAAHVRDDIKLPNPGTGNSISNGESITLYLSTYSPQYDDDHGTSYLSGYDHVLGISYAESPQAYMFSHDRNITGFSAHKVETSDGYVIEAKIPWSNFNNYTPLTNYRQMGVNVRLSDADENPSSVSTRMYWNAAKESDVETNPQELGMSYLDPEGGIYGTPAYALNVSSEYGTVTKNPDAASYNAHSLVTLTASPEAHFTGWSDGVTDNPRTFFMRNPISISANFDGVPVLTTIEVSPSTVFLNTGATQQFEATAYDQYHSPMSPQPSFTWSLSGVGTLSADGLYGAGQALGNATVTATSGSVSGDANVTVTNNPLYNLTTSVTGQGTVSPSSGTYEEGTEVSLTATPAAGYVFDNWSGDAGGTENPKNITMDADKAVTANFSPIPTYDLTTSVTGQGTVSPNSGTYEQGTIVTLTATPAAGYLFDSWSGDASGSSNPVEIEMDDNKSITANFVESPLPPPLVRLEFNEGSGSSVGNTGSVSATFSKTAPPDWSANVPLNGGASSVDFGTSLGNYYVESESILSELTGLTGFTVTGWVNNRSSATGSGGNRIVSWIKNGGNGVDIVYKSDGALQLGVNQWPDGSIALSSSGKIPTDAAAAESNWRFFAVTYESSSGSVKFYFGDNATPASLDKTISYDQGAVGSDIGKLAVGHFNEESSRTSRTNRMFRGLIDQVEVYGTVLSLAEIQTAQNIVPPVTYELSTSVVGQGTVSPSSGTYVEGSTVELTATPATGWQFDGWSGDASGSTTPTTITMDEDKSVIATFSEIPMCDLTVTIIGQGTVNPGTGSYECSSSITLTATPATGWVFDGWSGDASGTANPITFIWDLGERSVIATFIEVPTYSLTTSVNGQGTVSPSSGTYVENSEVELTANPASGWAFDGWSGDAVGMDNPVTIIMDSDKSVTAYFIEIPTYDLSTSVIGQGSVNPSSGTYEEGSTVEVTATPASGWVFDGWSGDASGSENPVNIVMEDNKSITATFIESPLPPALVRLGFNENSGSSVGNAGTVSATFTKTAPPDWSANVPVNGGASSVDFGTSIGNYYVESESIISELAGLTGFTVTGWVNNRSSAMGSGGNRIVSWIRNGGNGVDIVYKSDGALQVGINQWPDRSSALSSSGKIPTDASAPESNWRFFAVTYESSSGSLSFYFGDNATPASLDKTISYDQGAVGADIGKLAVGHFNAESSRTSRTNRMFRGLIDHVEVYGTVLSLAEIQTAQNLVPPVTYTLTTSVTGQGSISPSSGTYVEGSEVELTATPETGWQFNGWSGDASGTTSPETIIMNSDKSVTATFSQIPTYDLTTSVIGQGTVDPSSGTYEEGSSVELTATPAAGWQFDGWSGDAVGMDNPETIIMDSDKSVTAYFIQIPTYELTTSVIGQGTVNPSSGTYEEGSSVELTATPETGWKFDGWSGDVSGTENPITIIMDANKSVTAAFSEIPTYTLTYNGNGSDGGSVPVGGTHAAGASVTVSGPGTMTRTGYNFTGWNTSTDGSGTPYFEGNSLTMPAADLTLYAQWANIPTYTFAYDGNGSDGGSVPVGGTYAAGSSVTVSGPGTMTRTGYNFTGWNTSTDGSGTSYLEGNSLTMPAADLTLYAQWTLIPTYTFSYDGNGSNGGSVPVGGTYAAGASVTVSGPGTMTRTGYNFTGWNTSADGLGTSYLEGNSLTMPAADLTLYAQWTLIPTYTFSYDGNGSDGGSVPVGGTYAAGASVTVSGPGTMTRTGYNFTGWNTAANGSGTSYLEGNSLTMPAADITLFAQWTAIPTYELTTSVIGQGSVSPSSGTYVEGASVELTATPPTGWAFDGWSGDAMGMDNPVTIIMDSDKSVTAYFIEIPAHDLTTSVIGQGSVSPSSGTYEAGSSVELTAAPASGWVFDSWSGDASGTLNPLTIIMDEDKSITATFIESPLPPALVRLGFNENSGSSVGNTGTVSATFTKTAPPEWSANVPVNGGASSVDYGTSTGNYYVESESIISELTGLTGFTVTGWVNNRSSDMGSGGNRIVSWIKNGGNGVDIVYKSDGALQVGINQWPDRSIALSSSGKIPTDAAAPASNWRFFAVTYESSSGDLKFYFGDNATPAGLDKTISYDRGVVGSDIGKLAIGHFNAESKRTSRTNRVFRGLIDQIEIYGSVLSLAEIQTAQNLVPPVTYTLTTSVTGQGTINPESGTYVEGSSVELTASPATGWAFDGWSGDASGTASPVTIIMDEDKTVTATFVEVPTYDLTTSVTGQGTVSPSSGTYEEGSSVTLTAAPATGYAFDGWSGDLVGTANPIAITMDADKSVTANFIQVPTFDLTTSVTGECGYVTPSGGTYEEGSSVELTATPYSGCRFDGWGGDAAGTTNPITITMDANKMITANFSEIPTYELSVSVVGQGTVTPNSGTYEEGSEVELTAEPASGWVFDGWSGDASGSTNPTSITMDADKSVTATFVESPLSPALIRLEFNENSGSSVGNTGTASAAFTKTTPPDWSANVPVNGGASSVDFGTSIGNYYVESESIISELTGLASFTVTGWVNNRNSSMGSGGNRIVSWIRNGGNGVDIVYKSDGALQVGINQWPDGSIALSSSGKIPTDADAAESNWRFFAVTYESATGSLSFYFGDNATPASLDKTISYDRGAVGEDIGKLAIGHFNAESRRTRRTDRMFRGLIDRVEVYGTVLSIAEIQTAQNIGSP